MLQNTLKVSVVSYINSLPFIYGLENYTGTKAYSIEKDIPSVCAQKLLDGSIDVGLVPVAILPLLQQPQLLTKYCIGADGEVGSVLLLSEVPLEEIKTVLLDFHSRTSVQLVQVLFREYWKQAPTWKAAEADFISQIKGTTAAVVIGDRTFELKNKFAYSYDLAQAWKKFTGLPFVFAAWVANKKLTDEQLQNFNAAIEFGITNIQEVINQLNQQKIPGLNASHYLSENIQYNFDDQKRQGLELFLNYLQTN